MNREVVLAFPGLRMWEMSFTKGEQFSFSIPPGFDRTKMRSYMAHVEGRVKVTRTGTPLVDIKRPGDTSSTAPGWTNGKAPAVGRMTFRVLTDTYKYLCLVRRDNAYIAVTDVRPAKGESYTVPAGSVAILVMGPGAVTSLPAGSVFTPNMDGCLLLEVVL